MKRKSKSPEEMVAESIEDTARLARELSADLTVETIAGHSLSTHAHTVTLAHTKIAVESMEEVIERMVEEKIKRILEEEGVAIIISGKVKKYSNEKIAISKFDPRPDEISIEPEKDKDGGKFLEDLKNLR